jgi:hypothetical protein
MKLTIKYEYDPRYPHTPCWAKTSLDNVRTMLEGGRTFPEARQKLMNRIAAMEVADHAPCPPDEEVEVKIGEASYANQS